MASGKRMLPEPPRNVGGSPGQEQMKSFANRSPATAASGRVSTVSVHSSVYTSSRPASSHASGSRSGSPANVTLDEDERVGDDEMAAFYRKQRARQAKGEKMSGELEASLNFPDPIEPAEAMSPHGELRPLLENQLLIPFVAFIKRHFDSLSLYERREILDYSTIWFSGSKASKKAANLDASQNNYGYDDDRGDYLVNFGDHLCYRYEILGILGKGSFGQVLQCRDHRTGECVAIKIIRNKKRFHHQALVEVRILENLVEWVSATRLTSDVFSPVSFTGPRGQTQSHKDH